MKFEYKIKGVTLDGCEMYEIHCYYEALCTAEYLIDNYGFTDEEKAIDVAYRVRDLMSDYDYTEEDAIDKVLERED